MLVRRTINIERIAHFSFQFDDGTTTEKELKIKDVVTIVWNNSGHKEKITGRITNIEIDHFGGNSHNTISISIDGSSENHSNRRRIDADMILNILYPGEVDPDEPFEDVVYSRDNYHIFGVEDLNSPVIIIPETYRYEETNYRIIGIEINTFYNCDKLRILGLPQRNFIVIGSGAFFGCTNLVSVKLPESLKSIGNYAFMNCTSLELEVPNNANIIGENAFYDVKNLIYKGELSEAPWGAKLLNGVDPYAEIIDYTINTYSMQYIPEKVGDVIIPMSFQRSGKAYKIVGFGNNLFANCTELTSIAIPETVTRIGENCFLGCTGLKEIDVPSNVVNIGQDAFMGVENVNYTGTAKGAPWGAKMINGEEYIKEEHIENFVLDRKTCMRAGVKRTGDVVIPETFEKDGVTYLITEIADDTFYNCNELRSIVIPDSVKRIGISAFANCSRLNTVAFNTMTTKSLDPDTSLLEEIGDYAFKNCISLVSLRMPNNPSIMGKECFANCVNLKTMNIPDNMDYIPEGCFDSCFSLSKAVMGTNLTEIKENAFRNCQYLVATIADTVTVIGPKAFFNVQSISYKGTAEGGPWGAKKWLEDEGITIDPEPDPPKPEDPDDPTPPEIIYKDLTLTKDNLTDIAINVDGVVIIPDTYDKGEEHYKITKIADSTFRDIDTITKVKIPDTVTEICDHAFYHCTKLESIDIPDSVTIIGQHAFAYCTNLVRVNLPNKLYKINDNTFMLCTSLTNIFIPNVTVICTEAFYGCSKLEKLYIPDTVEAIGESAFYDVPAVYYNGDAAGYPWGADAVNDKIINVDPENPDNGENKNNGDNTGQGEEKPNPEIGEAEIVPGENEWE